MQLRVGVRSHLASLSMRTMLCLVGSPGTLLRSTRQDKKLLGRHDTGQNHVYPNRTMVPKLLRAAHSDAAARELRAPCSLVGNRPPCSLLRFFGKRVRENAAASCVCLWTLCVCQSVKNGPAGHYTLPMAHV
jgi:hypothetical protein